MPHCPFCQHENAPSADRCAGCGAALTTIAQSRDDDNQRGLSTGETPNQPLDERVFDLLADGRKIEAIKIYREETGASLVEAKEAVETIEREQAPLARSRDGKDPDEFHQQLERLLRDAGLIAAIKFYRERTGRGLKESKDAVEVFARQRGIPIKQTTGCGATAAVLLLLATALGACAAFILL